MGFWRLYRRISRTGKLTFYRHWKVINFPLGKLAASYSEPPPPTERLRLGEPHHISATLTRYFRAGFFLLGAVHARRLLFVPERSGRCHSLPPYRTECSSITAAPVRPALSPPVRSPASSRLAAGQVIFATVRSPLIRMSIAVLFAAPAAFAGYHATHGVAALTMPSGIWQLIFAVTGSIAVLVWGGRDRLDADGNADARSACTGKRRETDSTVSPGRRAGKCSGHSSLFLRLASIGRCRTRGHDLEGISLRPGGLGVAGASSAPVNGSSVSIVSVAVLGFLI